MGYTTSLVLGEVIECYAKRGLRAFLCSCVMDLVLVGHDNSFLREEERSISDKDFVNEMQIQVVMTTVDEGGRKGSALLEL